MYFTLYYNHNAIFCNSRCQYTIIYLVSTLCSTRDDISFAVKVYYTIIFLCFDPACVLTTRHEVDRSYFGNIFCRYRSLEACV